MSSDLVDVTIIGGGPTGLYGLFYAGMRGVSARLIDVLPELGGQLTALYPEKDVYDVAGFPKVLAKDLAKALVKQATQFDAEICLDEKVEAMRRVDDHFVLETDRGERPTRTLVIAAGKGAFRARRLDVPGFDEFWKRGVWPHVHDPEAFRDRRVLLVGGGDSAFDWSWALRDVAERIVHIHRSDRYRAHDHTVGLVEAAAQKGEIDLLTYHEVEAIHGQERITGATIFDNRTEERVELEIDDVLALIGFVPNIGPIAEWGLELEGNTIRVNSRMETNIPGVYAAGDVANYDGKLELISTGFGEAAIAVNYAVHHADPDAKVSPGHSTSSAAFREK
ncbi:MAG TPA: NAD(P)/FAD-dependent oxidoreductase [Gemmatimonadota bacterium]|nr:NAD(P)/FAD-dependent oxidoreductase [Gemmatimonadota bacterium]